MKIQQTLLVFAFGMFATIDLAASPLNYYVSGSFLTCAGCTFNTRTTADMPPLAYGDASPNNEIQFSSGGSTARINFAFLGTAATPVNLNTPTLLSYGIFTVDDTGGGPVNIGGFTFALIVHDLTDGGTTQFTGTSLGGVIGVNQSTVNVAWVPSVNFIGNTAFSIFTPTPLVPPTSLAGRTTIQGFVTSTAPEPMSMFLMGGGLVGVGLLARRKKL